MPALITTEVEAQQPLFSAAQADYQSLLFPVKAKA
jgi:hypothetical protein